MRATLTVPAVVGCLWAVVAGTPSTSVAQTPSLWPDPDKACRRLFDRLTHDFGQIAAGSASTTSFQLRNRTAGTFRIRSVQPGCGCTAVDPTRGELKPGDVSQIDVTFYSAGFEGAKEKTILVLFEQPAERVVTLTLRATVRSDLTVSPGEVDFGVLAPGVTANRSLQLNYKGRRSFHVLQVKASAPYLTVRMLEVFRQERRVGYEITIGVGAGAPLGRFKQRVDITTDDPQTPVLTVPVKGHTQGHIQVHPTAVFFGFLKPGQHSEKDVKLSAPRPFTITGVTGGGKGFKALYRDRPARTHVVRVQFTAGAAVGNVTDSLTFATDAGTSMTARVVVYAHVLQ